LTILADTGFVIAFSVTTDKWHEACDLAYRREPIIFLPESALSEIAYMLRRAGGVRGLTQILSGLRHSRFRLIHLDQQDIERISEVMQKYQDLPLDFVDASIIALAERLNITRILTVDRRDFEIVRPRHTPTLDLLP